MSHPLRVGVVGFGVAGGAVATLLARAGHAVTVFERAPSLGPVGAGLLLQPSGQAVLQRMGLLAEMAAQSEPIDGLHAFTSRGPTLIHLRIADALPGHRAYGVHRGLLFETLHRAARRAGVTIHTGQEIHGWRTEHDTVSAKVADGAEHGPFDLLLAADGSRSALRPLIDPNVEVGEYDFGALWSVGHCTRVRGYLHQVTEGTRHLLGLLPIGGDRCTLFWSVPGGQVETVRQEGFAAWREQVLRLSPLAEEVFTDLRDFDQVTFTTYWRVRMRRLHNGRVACLGDAGHAMSPHLGQGANLALLDAECLAGCLNEGVDVPSALAKYQTRRQAQLAYYAALSRFLTPFFQSEGWLLGAGRDVALPLMMRAPPLRREMERAMAGVKPGWFGPLIDVSALNGGDLAQQTALLARASSQPADPRV